MRIGKRLHQLWVADITYIRLQAEFVYLAVILDGFSRKVVSWELDRTLAGRLTIAALERAIENRQPPPGWCITRTGECNTPAKKKNT
jgi:putative transposase